MATEKVNESKIKFAQIENQIYSKRNELKVTESAFKNAIINLQTDIDKLQDNFRNQMSISIKDFALEKSTHNFLNKIKTTKDGVVKTYKELFIDSLYVARYSAEMQAIMKFKPEEDVKIKDLIFLASLAGVAIVSEYGDGPDCRKTCKIHFRKN